MDEETKKPKRKITSLEDLEKETRKSSHDEDAEDELDELEDFEEDPKERIEEEKVGRRSLLDEKDPLDDIDEEKPAKRHSLIDEDEPKPTFRTTNIDQEEIDPLDDESSVDDEKEEIDPIEKEDVKNDQPERFEAVEEEQPKRRSLQDVYEQKEEVEDQPQRRPLESTLDDLSEENIEEDYQAPQRPAAANRSFYREGEKSIPHISSLASQFPQSGIYSNQKASKGNWLHLLILVVIGLAAIGGTVYLLRGNIGLPQIGQQATPDPTVEPTAAPTATPEPTPQAIDRSEITLRVLNGTSTSGLAGTTAESLKELGYKIDRTGNATNSAFTKTKVSVKEGKEDLLKQIIADLADDFSAEGDTTLPKNETIDARIILGAE